MDANEKIKQLFYSTKEENRALAFELAKSQGCYEATIKELYEEWMVYPFFQKMQKQWKVRLGEIPIEVPKEPFVMPKGVALVRFYLEELCTDFFQTKINLEARHMPPFETFPLPLLNCTFLQELNLASNDIKTLPSEIGQLSQLKVLDLSHNYNLRNLSNSIPQLVQLETLYLTGIKEVFSQRTYQHQEAEQDQYTHNIPDTFRALTNLKKLVLEDVLLDGFPDWINEWTQLEEIHIYSSWGDYPNLHLPKNLMRCPKLYNLNISAYTTILPDNINQLTSLKHLKVQPALYIPSSIQQLKNLISLDFSYTDFNYPIHLEGYTKKWDLYDKGVPEGVSRVQIYGWEWIKKMTWLQQFKYIDIAPYAFTKLEQDELQEALPNCSFIFEE